VRVHRGERVVGDEDVGVRVERARDRDALLLAAAQRDAALADLVCSATSRDGDTQPGMSRRRASEGGTQRRRVDGGGSV